MGDNRSNAAPYRAEIDTTLPFLSVRAAVSLFGEKVDGRKLKFPERRLVREAELHQVQQELTNVREELTNAEKAKEAALYELREAHKLVEEMRKKLEAVNESEDRATNTHGTSMLCTEDMETCSMLVEEKHVVWEAQMKVAKEQLMATIAELETTKKELAKMKQDFLACLNEKEYAIKQAEEAIAAAEINAKRVDELSAEISGTNESLVLLKLACIEANKERVALLAAKEFAGGEGAAVAFQTRELVSLKEDLGLVQDLESNLATTNNKLVYVQGELETAKESKVKFTDAAEEAISNLENTKSELQQTSSSWLSAVSSLTLLTTELEEAKGNLKTAMDDGSSLQAGMEVLHSELEIMKKELMTLREREANATAAAAALTIELTGTKSELTAAAAAEAKAKKVLSGLSQALEQVSAEAEAAKVEAEAMREKVHKTKTDAGEAQAAMNTVESNLLAALKAADAAKAAENIALGQIRALAEKTKAFITSGVEASAGISISQDEYELLKKKVRETQDLTDMKVAAAMAQVEAMKASELEALQKLETANEDMEEMKKRTKLALHRAEMAEAAKSALEGELRKWREKEQQRKEKEEFLAAQQSFMRNGDHSFTFTPSPNAESLAKILNMKIPSETGSKSVERSLKKKKKKALLPSLGAFLVKKTNQIASSSPSSRFT